MTDVQTKPEAETTCAHGRPGAPRRAVFAGAGAVGAACLLAACGTSSGGQSDQGFTNDPVPAGSKSPATGNESGGGDTGGTAAGVLAATADVPQGGGIIKGDYVITQPESGTFKAFSKVCTHQGCDVSKVDGGVIFCPCHKSEFSIADGSPQSGPARKPLPETKVKVDGDNIVAA